jgi:hypothetical protein
MVEKVDRVMKRSSSLDFKLGSSWTEAGLLLDRSWAFVGQELGSFGLGLDWTYIVLVWIGFGFIFNYHQ